MRTGQALVARTRAELAALTVDIPGDPAAAGPARRPAPVRHQPLARAAAGAVGCLSIAFAAVWLAADVLDPKAWETPIIPGACCAWSWPSPRSVRPCTSC
jgi:hypothetical protein